MVTYAERPWTRFYDPAVPASLEPYPEIPLHQFLSDTAREKPHQVALVTSLKLPLFGRVHSELTYAELDRLSDALAVGLVTMGLQKGGRVAVVLPNTAAFVMSFPGNIADVQELPGGGFIYFVTHAVAAITGKPAGLDPAPKTEGETE